MANPWDVIDEQPIGSSKPEESRVVASPAEEQKVNDWDVVKTEPIKSSSDIEQTYDPAAIMHGSEPVSNEGRQTGKEAWKEVVKPTIEMASLIGGGIAGTAMGAPLGPAAPAVGVVMAGIGYSQAKKVTETIEKLMAKYNGEQIPDESLKNDILTQLADVRDGMMMDMAGPIAGKVIGGTGQFLLGPGSGKMGATEMAVREAAKRQGIKLSPGEATGSKTMLQVEGMLYNAPLSADIVQKFQFKNQLDPLLVRRAEMMETTAKNPQDIDTLGRQIYKEVNDYLIKHENLKGKALEEMRARVIAEIGSNDGPLLAGLSTQEKIFAESQLRIKEKNRLYDKATEEVKKVDSGAADYDFKNMKETAESILKENEKFPKSSLSNTARDWLEWAAGREKLHPDVKARLDAAAGGNWGGKLPDDIRSEIIESMRLESPELFSAKLDFETLTAARRKLNELIAKENPAYQKGASGFKGQLTPEGNVYTKLKNAIGDDWRNVIESTGGEAKKALDTADAFFVENIQNGVRSKIIQRMAYSEPEKLVDIAFTPNGTSNVLQLKKFLGDEKFSELKGQFTNKIMGLDSGAFDPNKLSSNLIKYRKEFLSNVYNIEEMQFLKTVAKRGIDLTSMKIPSDAFAKTLASKTPETIVDTIIGASEEKIKSDVLYKNVLNIKKVVSEDTFKNISDSLIGKIFQINPKTDYLPPATFSNMVNKYTGVSDYGRNVLEAFGYSKDKIANLKELANIAGRVSSAQRLAAPGSITAPNQITWGSLRGIMLQPLKGAAMAIGPQQLAKLWFSDFGLKYLVDGFKLPVGSRQGISLAAKITGILNSDEIRENQENL